MPSIEWNKQHWGERYPWPADGDEWSYSFGSAAAHWYAFILPRLHRFLPDAAAPASRIAEIAPGHGRWTQFLLGHCKTFAAYDVSERCIAHCRDRFKRRVDDGTADFRVTDGFGLAEPEASVDLVFSFDSLVHAERDVMRGYLSGLARCLKPGRCAFLQHSNLGAYPALHNYRDGGPYILRATTVSAATVQEDARAAGLTTLLQEGLNHETQNMNNELVDCISVIQKPLPGRAAADTIVLSNRHYPAIGKVTRDFALPYERCQTG